MLNKVMLIGNLGADPTIRYTPNGDPVVTFNLATTIRFKGQDGSLKETTDWHRVVLFGKLASVYSELLRKGMRVYVEGRIRTRSWVGNDGQKRFTTEIVARQILILSPKKQDISNFSGGLEEENYPQDGNFAFEDEFTGDDFSQDVSFEDFLSD